MPDAAAEAASPGALQAARDAYCETIFTERLYGRLSAAAQRMLSQAMVFGLAVTVDGLAAVAGVAAPAVREAAAQWRASALAHMNTGSGRDLWSVYGMLRGWLLAPERLSAEDRRAAHLAAGGFLVELNRQDREGELGVSWVVCLLPARAQYLAAGTLDQARAVTGQISGSRRSWVAGLRFALRSKSPCQHVEGIAARTRAMRDQATPGRKSRPILRPEITRGLFSGGRSQASDVSGMSPPGSARFPRSPTLAPGRHLITHGLGCLWPLNRPLDAPVRNQPHEGDQHVDRVRDAGIDEHQQNAGEVERGRELALDVGAERSRQGRPAALRPDDYRLQHVPGDR